MATVKKIVEVTDGKGRKKGLQLSLFELIDNSESEYSNTIELYDALPKYVWDQSDSDLRENSVITRNFKSRGVVYTVKIKPAVIERKNKAGDMVSVMLYPGSREEIVEEALRKIAINGNSFESEADKNVGVFFTVSQLCKELARTNHTYSNQEVVEALDVMSSSLLECSLGTKGKGRDMYRGNFLTSLALTSRDQYLEDGSTKCFATFHPLVTHGIRTQKFRLYDYSISMGLKSDLARYMFKRMSHYWTQASLDHPYNLKLVSFLTGSPRGLSPRMKDNMRAMRSALKALVDEKVLLPDWDEEVIKDANDRRITLDVAFAMLPHENFVKHMMRANRKHNEVVSQVELADARSALKGAPKTIHNDADETGSGGSEDVFS
ncbi:MAG: replication protein [Dehalococcoidia bacterium]|uniref:replication protein n=1 Tax=unclassified Pseudomonas TaxID=196821 RepID=UPI0021CC8099|nr:MULTISPECIES: replication protein [unclassified Pseudomonas]